MKANDEAPVFPEKVKAEASLTENGDYRITFTEADVPDDTMKFLYGQMDYMFFIRFY